MSGLRRAILSRPALRNCYNALADLRDGIVNPHPFKASKLEAEKFDVVFLGPWLGEVGPEYGYWIPFLQQLKNNGVFQGKRVIAISRGGVAAWYSKFADEYVELLDLLTADEFKAARAEQPTAKQIRWTNAEQFIAMRAAESVKVAHYSVIHPGFMWQQIRLWLRNRRGLEWLLQRVAFEPFGPAPTAVACHVDSLGLPSGYTFVRFYSSKLFPWNVRTQEFCQEIVRRLAAIGPVVTTGLKSTLDDHEHLTFGGEVIDLSDQLPPNINLGVQTELVRRADRFVGTYGGLSVLPAFAGRPSFSFYAESLKSCDFQDIHFRHEAITTEIFRQLNQPYQVINLTAWENMECIFKSS